MSSAKNIESGEDGGADRGGAFSRKDYERDKPRWCPGCGALTARQAVQKIFCEKQIPPEKLVCVSGIGCSGRFPHYLGTYGFHGLHGRALPVSVGIALARPDLQVLTVMGDGDCFSIGAGHWVHATRYNPDITVLVLDNGVYALTKKQASPTSRAGTVTYTTPEGSLLQPMNPLSIILGIANVSFVAQTASWLMPHMEAALGRALAHRGMSFIRVLQRCPAFMADVYGPGRGLRFAFLENSEGIAVHQGPEKEARVVQHDQASLPAARAWAEAEVVPLGLLYCNPALPTYQDVRLSRLKHPKGDEFIAKLNQLLDRYAVGRI